MNKFIFQSFRNFIKHFNIKHSNRFKIQSFEAVKIDYFISKAIKFQEIQYEELQFVSEDFDRSCLSIVGRDATKSAICHKSCISLRANFDEREAGAWLNENSSAAGY